MQMNERVKELALEVFSFKYKTNPNELNPGHHMDHIHKFAELIIEECAKVCVTMPLIGPYKEVQDATLKDAAREIKEHFEQS